MLNLQMQFCVSQIFKRYRMQRIYLKILKLAKNDSEMFLFCYV